ncbi:MAG: hypothetical protein RLZZ598_1265 [Pseudomonadota bacterium]|jgi:hypothetical protein
MPGLIMRSIARERPAEDSGELPITSPVLYSLLSVEDQRDSSNLQNWP